LGLLHKRSCSQKLGYLFQKAWHLDSGATDHICNDKSAFLEIRRLSKPIQVWIGDNSIVPATGIGSVLLSTTGKKQLRIQLTDKGCDIQFSKNGQITILNRKDQSMATAYRKNGMYEVEVSSYFLTRNSVRIQKQKRKRKSIPTIKPLSMELWHHRLGHLNRADIATGIQIQKNDSQDRKFCISCLEGKMNRQYNKQVSTKAPKKLELIHLIHSGLCDPFPTQSVLRSRYFIIFVDDATRFTWAYFLKTKGAEEVLQIFQQFKALVEQEAGASIHRFRCDNGTGEYNNQLFKDFLSTNGITLEPSAPYTQNQNSVSERTIRTIIEKVRTMLLNAKLSEGF